MRIVMMGTGTFAEPTFESLLAAKEQVVGLVTQPDRDAGNKRGSTRQTGKGMATIAAAAGVQVLQPESINTPEGVESLKAFAPDLLVVAAYGQILKPAVIEVPTRGAINVHASLLPKYRGAAPVAHAILNGETETGVTIIRITPGLDAGEMLAKGKIDILPDETAGELEARLAPLGARLALDVVHRMKAGPVPGEKQDPAHVTKAPKLTKEMGLIDWTRGAFSIRCHIRAMQPWPTAYTFLHQPGKQPERIIICRVGDESYRPTLDPGPSSGTIWAKPTEGVMGVECGRTPGRTTLVVIELQAAGKKRMTAAEFLRGHPAVDGMRFGPPDLQPGGGGR
jgi:methionyl-tRNA formyltransferase